MKYGLKGKQIAPGNQQEFGELIAAWVETGAACPADSPADGYALSDR